MKGEAVNKSGISCLLFLFVFGVLMYMMLYVNRHLSDSVANRHLHLTRSLREANMPREQASALVDAIDGAGQDTHSIPTMGFSLMAGLLSMAIADIYDLHRRLKKLESKVHQPSCTLSTDRGSS
jgi:hypothetical protein